MISRKMFYKNIIKYRLTAGPNTGNIFCTNIIIKICFFKYLCISQSLNQQLCYNYNILQLNGFFLFNINWLKLKLIFTLWGYVFKYLLFGFLPISLNLIISFSEHFFHFWIFEKYLLYYSYVMIIVLCNDETRYYNVNSSLSKISIQYSPILKCIDIKTINEYTSWKL